jgi:hypothetical protein
MDFSSLFVSSPRDPQVIFLFYAIFFSSTWDHQVAFILFIELSLKSIWYHQIALFVILEFSSEPARNSLFTFLRSLESTWET